MAYGLSLITGPAEEPLSLEQARLHLRVDGTTEDELILALIVASREWAEGYTRRCLLPQTWDMSLSCFPSNGIINVPRSPLRSVTSITYVDVNGATQTMDAGQYIVDTSATPGRIVRAYGVTWPITRPLPQAVKVRFSAGFSSVADVPESIKAAMKLRIGCLYESREAPANMEAAESLLSLHRVVEF